jgi:hypothetical protein
VLVESEKLVSKFEGMSADFTRIMKEAGADRPDWAPIEKVLPLNECRGFMFMGYSGEVRMYKHGFTRNYLNVDPGGHTYWYDERHDSYFRVAKELAIDHAFEGIDECGATRSTPFDDEARRKRAKAMKDAGWTVMRVTPDGTGVERPN